MKFVFLILLSSDTVGTNIAQYIVSFFSVLSLTLLYKEMFQCLDSFFFLQQLYRGWKNLHFNFSLMSSIIEGQKNFGNFHNHIIMCMFAHMDDIILRCLFMAFQQLQCISMYILCCVMSSMLFARVGICYYWFIDMLLKQSFGYKKKRIYIMYLFTGYDENNL